MTAYKMQTMYLAPSLCDREGQYAESLPISKDKWRERCGTGKLLTRGGYFA